MTKERLEELRKQCATVWIDCPINGEFCEVELDDSYKIKDFGLYHEHGMGYSLQWVFETKERAMWHHKTHTERTERFEPPMWEDIKDGYLFTFIKPKDIHTIAFAVNWGVLWENEIVILYDDDYCVDENRTIFNEPATKENYEKACEIVRDLFTGANNGQK